MSFSFENFVQCCMFSFELGVNFQLHVRLQLFSCAEFVILVTLNKLYAVVVNNLFFISTSFIWFDLPLIWICTIHF
jgi:hypothetical protein